MPMEMTTIYALIVIIIDQYTKKIATNKIREIKINRGIAFGLFPENKLARVIYSGTWFFIAYLTWKDGSGNFPAGLILGGTLSNIIDIIRIKGVIDWIKGSTNFADIAITIGLAMDVIYLFLHS